MAERKCSFAALASSLRNDFSSDSTCCVPSSNNLLILSEESSEI